MRGNLCHVSQAVRRHSTEEDLKDANEKRRQHRRRLQDNVLTEMTDLGCKLDDKGRGIWKEMLRDADTEGWCIIF